ncbi:MAG: hypothetical protein UR94_C0001G0040 [Parcubacteria group bacterium GW2011_GWA2_36_10]|nr:MAG: hypothetical protein UR94_C0001G0040 [Parcubacteria group bacterium GW2011_GWA2_36_10]
MPNKIKSFCLLAFILFLSACGQKSLIFEKQTYNLVGVDFVLDLAKTPEQYRQGLSNREGLEQNQGMLFIYPEKQNLSFWMKEMNFAIDLVWLLDGKIMAYIENMPKLAKNTALKDLPLYTSPMPVNQVLELPSGTIQRLKLQVGQELFSK